MEGVLSMKKKVFLTIIVALSVAIAGCGSKDSNIVENQKEATVKDTDNKKAENQKKNLEKDTEKSEESGSKEETIVKEDEKAASQQTVSTDSNSSDTNDSSGNTTSNNGSGNTAGNGNASSTSGGHTDNGSSSSSGSTSSGGSSSDGSSNSSNGNSTPASTPTPAPTQPVHTHTWVHVDATGHEETEIIQEASNEEVPVYEDIPHAICNQCGADITNDIDAHLKANLETCWAYHTEWKHEQTGTQIVHHDAETEKRWIEDTPAHDVCSGCGITR